MTRTLRTLLFGISLQEATFERRRFPACDPQARERLESIGFTFLTGYLAALDASGHDELVHRLAEVDHERQGFAYEGAAMALGLMDMLLPWRRDRWSSFTNGPAARHCYMMQVGLGWAFARLHRNAERAVRPLDPLIGWLAVDGYGFHECYFKWERVMVQGQVPRAVTGYARNAFDQGVGRCMWFVNGADPERLAHAMEHFDASRRPDLWSGVGLASAYAGGVPREALDLLRALSGDCYPALAQGVMFATETRLNAGNLTAHTEMACNAICDMTPEAASAIVHEERRDLKYDSIVPAYELWRTRIQTHFTSDRDHGSALFANGFTRQSVTAHNHRRDS